VGRHAVVGRVVPLVGGGVRKYVSVCVVRPLARDGASSPLEGAVRREDRDKP